MRDFLIHVRIKIDQKPDWEDMVTEKGKVFRHIFGYYQYLGSIRIYLSPFYPSEGRETSTKSPPSGVGLQGLSCISFRQMLSRILKLKPGNPS